MKRAVASGSLLLIMLGLGAAFTSHAQLQGTDPLTITIFPNYPRPYDTVTVVPDSQVFDLSAASLTVSANGAVVNRTTGAEPSYITVGGPGSVTTITVSAVANGQTFTKSMTIRPADVSLIVEPQSTTHPFYDGGALVASEGTVRLVAVPDVRTAPGTPVSADKLVYTWKLGDQVLQAQSGIGRSVLTAAAPPRYRDATITLTVTTQDQKVVAQATTLVSPDDPFVYVYQDDPLLGPLFNRALPRSFTMPDSEESLRAVPYYFVTKPALTWDVNGTPSGTTDDITVRANGAGTGTALLSVTATGPATSGQNAKADLSVTFGSQRTFNFFGI